MKEKLLISACLLGRNCKYSGGNNYTPAVEKLKERYELVPVCPECMGGLPIPHDPSERVGDRVLSTVEQGCRPVGNVSVAVNEDPQMILILLGFRMQGDLFKQVHSGQGAHTADDPYDFLGHTGRLLCPYSLPQGMGRRKGENNGERSTTVPLYTPLPSAFNAVPLSESSEPTSGQDTPHKTAIWIRCC